MIHGCYGFVDFSSAIDTRGRQIHILYIIYYIYIYVRLYIERETQTRGRQLNFYPPTSCSAVPRQCLRPASPAAEVPIHPNFSVSLLLAAGEDALANVSLEKLPSGRLTGSVRIRSRTQVSAAALFGCMYTSFFGCTYTCCSRLYLAVGRLRSCCCCCCCCQCVRPVSLLCDAAVSAAFVCLPLGLLLVSASLSLFRCLLYVLCRSKRPSVASVSMLQHAAISAAAALKLLLLLLLLVPVFLLQGIALSVGDRITALQRRAAAEC